ncbi:unnamed protein product [Lathyrus sativus]|nr:unnamed protein product [Lathyrus sativus]
MATAREENRYEGGGGYGKFRKRPLRKSQPTPYDRPPTALRNPNQNNGWLSKLIDPAQRFITYSAHKLFSSVFRKRLPPPPPSETVQEASDKRQKAATFVANELSGKQQGVVGESSDQTNLSDRVCLPELEKLLKQKTFTRSETDHLIELMRSRSVDTAVGEEGKMTEVVPLESMLHCNQKEEHPQTPALENRIENHLVSPPHATSSIPVEDVASPAQLAKAYMESRPSKVSPSVLSLRSPTGEDSTLLKGHFAQKSPVMSIVPRATNHARVYENGFLTPRSRGRSAIYTMAQTPYPKVYPASTLKGAGVGVEDGPSSSTQHALSNGILSGTTKQGGLKRRSSVLGNDIRSFGRIRRIRHKSNLISSKGLTLTHSDGPLSITSHGVASNTAQQPSSFIQKPILSDEVNYSHRKSPPENVGDTMPSSNFPPLPSKSSEMASKILQQLDNMVSPKEKSSALRLPNVNDKSPTKLSSSMLRGQALRSMETVDSSKLLDNVKDNKLDGNLKSLSASSQKLASKINKVENGLKPVSSNGGLTTEVTGSVSTVPSNQVISIGKSGDSSDPPSKKWAFRMSAHEDYLELDDEAYPNEAVSPFSTSEKETKGSTAAAIKTVSALEKPVQKIPGSSVVTPSKSFIADGKLSTADVPIVAKVDTPTSITSSIATDPTVKPSMGEVKSSAVTILGSDKSSSPNGSAANLPLFNFGNNFVSSTESTKTGPVFGLDKADKAALSKETSPDAKSVKFGFNKNIDSVPQASFTFSPSAGGESTFLKFGGASDSKLSSISSITAAGIVDSVPKVLESNSADVKASMVSKVSAQSSEPSAASTSLSTSPANIFTFGNSSSQNNGSAASSPTLSSPFLPVVSNSLTSQNMLSSSSLATSSSSINVTATSTTSMTTSTSVVNASSNSSSSTSVMTSLSPTTSLFKFGSTPLPSTSLPVSSSRSEPVETKDGQNAGIGKIESTSFGSSSAAAANAGNGIFGLSSLATSANSQSQTQGSIFGTVGGSTIGTLAPSATSGFATSTQSQSVAFGSSTPSPLFGLAGSSSLPSSSPVTNIFNSGLKAGQSTPASSLEANPVSSNNGTNSTLFGVPSWQPSKSSPFGTPFSSSSSSSSTSVFSFGTSAPSVVSTSSPMIFGSSTGASGSQFSFTSAAATTNTQPAFGNSSPVFAFGSASVNNDQMSMEDSMAEDTVQATQPATPVFGQQPAQAQSNFVFGAPTPTGASPFQFGGQQNIAPQNPSPFQASGSLEFNAGGSFSLGTGGVDKSGRKHIKIKHRQRKK